MISHFHWCKPNFQLAKYSLWALLFSWIPPILIATPAFGADRVTFSFGLLEFSVSADSLATYAQEGRIDQELATHTHHFEPSTLVQIRQILTARLDLSSVEVSQFLYSSFGETALRFLGELIQTDARQNGFYALRSALILAAAEPDGLTLLNVIQQFPTPTLCINSSLALQMVKEFTALFQHTEEAVALIEQQAATEASNQSIVLTQGSDLGQSGAIAWQKEVLTLNDQSRDRQFVADLYLPDLQSPAPVIVISHGLGSSRASFAYLAQHLASHGFAVAVLEHPNSDAQQLQNLMRGFAGEVTDPQEFIDRPKDISYLLDELQRMNQTSSPMQGRLNLQQVGAIGHSFGGYTVLALAGAKLNLNQLQQCNSNEIDLNIANPSMLLQCLALSLPAQEDYRLQDDRIRAVVSISPFTSGVFSEIGLQKIQIPTLFVAGGEDMIAPALLEKICSFTWLTMPDKYLVFIKNGTHVYSNSTDETDALALLDRSSNPHSNLARSYLKTLSLAFAQTHVAAQTEYSDYLTNGYAQLVSQPSLPLSLVQSLPSTERSNFCPAR